MYLIVHESILCSKALEQRWDWTSRRGMRSDTISIGLEMLCMPRNRLKSSQKQQRGKCEACVDREGITLQRSTSINQISISRSDKPQAAVHVPTSHYNKDSQQPPKPVNASANERHRSQWAIFHVFGGFARCAALLCVALRGSQRRMVTSY